MVWRERSPLAKPHSKKLLHGESAKLSTASVPQTEKINRSAPHVNSGSSLILFSQKHTCRRRRRNGGELSEARQAPDVHRSCGVACEEQQTIWGNNHAGHSRISIFHLHEEESEVKRGYKRGRMQCGIINGTLQQRLQKPSSLAFAGTRHCTIAHHTTCHVPKKCVVH